MPKAPSSKAVLAVPTVGDQWHRKRVSRKLDDRDQVLEEAIQLVEEHDVAVYPYIEHIRPAGAGVATWTAAAGSDDFTLTFSIGGVGCSASSTVTCVVGTQDIASGSIAPGSVSVVVTFTGGLAALASSPTARDYVGIYLRIDDVLCPVISFVAT